MGIRGRSSARLVVGVLALTLVAGSAAASATSAAAAALPGGSFTSVKPTRLLDTRSGLGAPKRLVSAGGRVTVPVAGKGGVPASGVAAVVLNVSVSQAARAGYVTAYPAGLLQPRTTTVAFPATQSVAGLTVVKVGTHGSVVLYTSQAAHLAVDVTGWYSTSAGASDRAGLFHPLRPARIANSRMALGVTTPGAKQTRNLPVAGRGGVPASGVGAVVLNVTAVAPTNAGSLAVYPTGASRTLASLTFAARETRSNRVIVPLGQGKVTLYNAAGSTPVLVDVVGWFSGPAALPGTGGAYFVSTNPFRLVDTRAPGGAPLGPDDWDVHDIAGRAGMPTGFGTAFPVAVVATATAYAPTKAGALTVFPPGFGKVRDSVPGTTDVHFAAGRMTSNLAVSQLHAGRVGYYNRTGTTGLQVDVAGYFALPTSALQLEALVPAANHQVAGVRMSGSGRYLAMTTYASNLVGGDTNDARDAFVLDRTTGVVRRASVDAGGQQADGSSWDARVSDDGRYVAFTSDATNLVPGDTNENTDVFVRDLDAGTTVRLNVGPDGAQADGSTYGITMSADGSRVAFVSGATTLVPDDTNDGSDAFVADVNTRTVSRVSTSSDGSAGNGNVLDATISGNGRYVAFASEASNLVADDTNGGADLFVHDLTTGETTRENVSSAQDQAGDPGIMSLSISDDGGVVVFDSAAGNLVAGDTNNASDVFIRDRVAGTTMRITAAGQQAGGYDPIISGDGSTILFASTSKVLSPLWQDSYGETRYVYRRTSGTAIALRGYDYLHSQPSMNRTGTVATIMSDIDNVAPNDTDNDVDSFLLALP